MRGSVSCRMNFGTVNNSQHVVLNNLVGGGRRVFVTPLSTRAAQPTEQVVTLNIVASSILLTQAFEDH